MIAIRGYSSTIAQELAKLLPADETVHVVHRGAHMPTDADRYFICQGLLRPKSVDQQTKAEIEEGWEVNLRYITKRCDWVLSQNDRARICVIGSESAFSGSYDMTYATTKKLLHDYVKEKRLYTPEQQLVCVAPSIIEDSGMTERRLDQDRLDKRRREHPKRRFLRAREVARLVRFLLYVDDGYVCNAVIRMNGGEHTWRK